MTTSVRHSRRTPDPRRGQEETFGGLLSGVVLVVLPVCSVMAVPFDSLRHPLVIMGAVPFALIGVVATLVLTGTTFDMNSFLGVIVRVGTRTRRR